MTDRVELESVPRCWHGETVVVAAPGPSLTPEVAEQCCPYRAIAVQDAYRFMPWADVLYGCDAPWWRLRKGCPDFLRDKWSTHDSGNNDKKAVAKEYGLRLVAGMHGPGFSVDPAVIHYGLNSGFQAVNLAILMGAARIVLVGFDMRVVDGQRHFFGDYPSPVRNTSNYDTFIRAFASAAKVMPSGVRIVNATPGSALTCFPMLPLDEALAGAVAVAA